MKILISEPLPEAVHQETIERLSQLGEVRVSPDTKEETFRQEVQDADIFVVRLAKVSAAVLESAEKLRVIARPAVGVDNIDIEAATRLGIPIVYSPGSNTDSTAEHTFALILALDKHVCEANAAAKEGRWGLRQQLTTQIRELAGATLGIIGLGAVGRRVAELASAFRLRVIAHSEFASAEDARRLGAELTDMDTLLAESDYVTIHTALTERTRGLINEQALAKMKPSAFLINTARGPVIDEDAVLAALDSGRIQGAALDVFSVEPPDPDHPLLKHPKVLVTPHIAGMSRDSTKRMYDVALDDLFRLLDGKPAQNVLNPQALQGASSRLKGIVQG
ncbi:MAG TPA: hydroxyacid dehydrogenase [Dehalococcoidia bacterium]|nr:hydroxyacid dehydrogenase [Dehalococcoidia bacterium]